MNQIQIIKRQTVTRGQKTLLDLVCKKIELGKPINSDEAVAIWTEKVCRNKRFDTPIIYDHWLRNEQGERVGGWVPMSGNDIKNRAIQWLVVSIGSLVVKGYLKIVPQLEIA